MGTAGDPGPGTGDRGSERLQRPDPRSPVPGRKKRLGVIGTFVWDVIHGRDVRSVPVEEWGGIAYALGALDAALSDEWEIAPIMKVGYDRSAQAGHFMGSLRRLASDAALVEVPYPNNRVELFYYSSERRSEILHGGVPGWTWLGLKQLLGELDAIYVNFISGYELDLETAQLLRQHFRGPIYGDLHSLLTVVQPGGLITAQALPNVDAWCRCFDVVQVNEEEMAVLAPDPLALAATALGSGVQCLVVTMSKRGAVFFAQPDFETLGLRRRADALTPPLGPVRTALVPTEPVSGDGDPTGCGDVWGATCFSRLLAGANLPDAMRAAHAAAGRNVVHRGASGLAAFLRGEIHTP